MDNDDRIIICILDILYNDKYRDVPIDCIFYIPLIRHNLYLKARLLDCPS
jgi:hypothetical protein